jgi:hypothetical protein
MRPSLSIKQPNEQDNQKLVKRIAIINISK